MENVDQEKVKNAVVEVDPLLEGFTKEEAVMFMQLLGLYIGDKFGIE